MREILFRGKAINRNNGYHRTKYKNGDWVYGLLTRLYDERFENLPAEMTNTDGVSGVEVDANTIGQFTGIYDNTEWENLTHEEQKQFYYKHYPEYDKTDKYPPIGTVKHLWKGKPIFEGDIVKKSWLYTYYVGHREYSKVNSFVGQVTYNSGVFEMQEHGEVIGFLGNNDTLEVIGNIHDNPELLTEAETT